MSRPTSYGFSPHGRYFGVATYSSGTARLEFYNLATCASAPIQFSVAASQAPTDGDVAGWGFAPTANESRLMLAGSNSQARPEVTLVNLATNRSQLVASPNNESLFYFSPCGDLFGLKNVENSPVSRRVFTLFRTRDFEPVSLTGNAVVETTSTFRDAWLNANAQGHRLK